MQCLRQQAIIAKLRHNGSGGESNTRACYTLDARLARVYAFEPTALTPRTSRWPARDVEGSTRLSTGIWKSETTRMGSMNVGPGTRIRDVLASCACAGSEWSRSSLTTGHLPARCVYKRVWSRSKICVILAITILSNLILSIISIRPGVALSLKKLLIQHSLLNPTTNLSPTIKMVRITAAAVLACEFPFSHSHEYQPIADLAFS